MRRATGWSALGGVLALVAPGEAVARDATRAAALFSEGREAATAHDYALACRKFAESEAEDPHVGTLINLGQCEEAQGLLAASHAYWQQALDLARAMGDARTDYVGRELARIEPRVPRVTVRLAASAPQDTVIRRDGVVFERASFGLPLPVEPGAHELVVLAAGRDPRRYAFTVVEAQRLEIVVDPGALEPDVAKQVALPDAVPIAPPSVSPERPDEHPATLRTVATSTAIAGLVGLGVGATYGALALQDSSNASGHCNGNVCDGTGTTARNDEITKAQIATVALAAGGTLLVTGAVLRVLSPSRDEVPYVRRNLGLVVGATGLAGLVVGSLFALRAVVDHRDATAGCANGPCNPQGSAAQSDESGATVAAAVGLATGGALAVTGAVLAMTSGRQGRHAAPRLHASPWITARGSGLMLGASW